jgi:hypothetical protein
MWQYYSVNVSGNIHEAMSYLNGVIAKEHPEHEVVAMHYSHCNTIVVYRVRFPKS